MNNPQKAYQYTIYREDRDGKVYVRVNNENATGRFGKQKHYYRFSNEEQREKWIENFVANVNSHEKRKAERKAERLAFKNPAKVGDILYSSWGYDQTNIDYYQVTQVMGKSVKIREIGKQFVGSEPGSDIVKAAPNSFKGEEMLKRVRAGYSDTEAYSLTLNSYSSAYLTDANKENRQTDAYSGH